ncbi:hypothetical protein H072_4790 [Dactylellina haptotyla CBS 200.50]|uniref:Uncharacterized protein n=1 Tax=Dactylellina haptotyla (strain CBS 200.50) TaxID=1284197 RepID=S8AJC8_DACHA|nr:hypothetical protein H072_4790 [Dactylellina haptotyla CBS 200.50]
MPLPTYKLVIWRNESGDPKFNGVHTSTFDYMENPIPQLTENSLLKLINCCSGSLKFTEKVLNEVNSNQEVQKSNTKYCLAAMDIWGNDWRHRGLVLKLVDFNPSSYNCDSKNTANLDSGPEPTAVNFMSPISTSKSQSRYKFAVIRENDDGSPWSMCYGCSEDPIPEVYKARSPGSYHVIHMTRWPKEYHELIDKLTRDLDNSLEVAGHSGSYHICAVEVHEDDETHEKWRSVVWELNDTQTSITRALSSVAAGTITPASTIS